MNIFKFITSLVQITSTRCIAALTGLTILLLPGSVLQTAAAQNERPSGVSAGAIEVPVRPALNAGPAEMARFAEEVLVENGIRDWALAVIHEGRPVERRFSAGVGGAVETVNGETMFDLGSVAKLVIAWGVMNLVEAGQVDLDQPIEQYLSRWQLPPSDFDHREVTVRRVLSHTAGLSWGRRQHFAAGEILPPIEKVLSGTDSDGRRLEVIVEPGTQFIYSNDGYTLLQLFIEEVSGRSFDEFMEEEVLHPLRMEHSVFSPDLPEAPLIQTIDALGRAMEVGDRVATATSLISSLDESTAFAVAHLEGNVEIPRGGGVLLPASLDSMLTPVTAAGNRRGLGYSVRQLYGDLLVAGHSGGGGDIRVVPKSGDGLVILTNSTVGYIPIERIQCVWTSWLTGTKERCSVPSSYALLGAYRHGGIPAALDYYDDLVDRADPDYLVGIEQLSEFARLFVGAGMDDDAAAVYRYMSRSGTPETAIYGEAADRLLSGHQVSVDRLPCYLGEYRSSSDETIRLEPADDGLTVTIDPVVGIGGPVRMLTDHVFLFDFGGFIGELVFDLAESGAAKSVTVRESAFGISLTAERSSAEAATNERCAVMKSVSDDGAGTGTGIVHIAPPTGRRDIDRASILSALEEVEPGGTVQFASGMYVVGQVIQINIPQITLLGHPEGTILRGCDPDEFTEIEKTLLILTASNPTEGWAAVSGCGMLALTGGYVTVRNLTFEYTRLGLLLGSSHVEDILYPSDGGYLIEKNTFRNSSNSIRALLASPEPTFIRNNRFINVFHALSAGASYIHMLDNHISVPEPERIPLTAHPGFAIGIHEHGAGDSLTTDRKICNQNIIKGNWIEGHPDGITISSYSGKNGCRKNVIEGNTIIVHRVPFFASWPYFDDYPLTNSEDSTFVGIPLALYHYTETGQNHSMSETKDNVIKGNLITGGFGLGIEISNASQNRIENNTITGISRRELFPGNTLGGTQFGRTVNGSGIRLSPGSNGNEIIGNTFEEVASYAVVLEGDSNRVEVLKADDAVCDLGSGNNVSTKNDHVEPLYESKFVEARGIRLQYMDFGGEGLPIIFLQDFHDYFYEGSEWPPFYAHFTSNHRVLAPYQRGWSESDDTGWGYDVATQSEDILGFMDALGIKRAVLAGRTGGTHEMTWIAEHHPERVAGLVYIQNLRVFPDTRDPLARSFIEMTWITCHMGEESVARLGPRSAWRPHFLFDESARVNIPSIRFFSPEFEQHSRELSVLSRIEQWGSEAASRCADEETQEEYDALSSDKERVAALRKALIEADLTTQTNRAMERAFGNYMTTIVWNDEVEDLLEFEIPHIDRFLEKVKTAESRKME